MNRFLKKSYAAALRLWTGLCRRLPLQRRVLFFSIRAEGRLLENAQCVYDALPSRKVIFAHKHPLPARYRPKLRYLMLTSKVIVTDDYMPELREVQMKRLQILLTGRFLRLVRQPVLIMALMMIMTVHMVATVVKTAMVNPNPSS